MYLCKVIIPATHPSDLSLGYFNKCLGFFPPLHLTSARGHCLLICFLVRISLTLDPEGGLDTAQCLGSLVDWSPAVTRNYMTECHAGAAVSATCGGVTMACHMDSWRR